MPTPEQQIEYTRLSGLLQAIGHRYYKELPNGATSLRLTNTGGKVLLEVYDRLGKQIGIVPNEKTSSALSADLQRAFAHATSFEDPVICPL
jgi:hypothetical protein